MLYKSTSTKIAGIISAAVLILLTVFTSCDNFAAGSLLKEEIQKEIAYAKAQEVNIMVAPSDSAHGTTYPNITKTYKVSDSFSVRFKEAESYYFVKWVAKDVSSDQIVTDIVEFENPDELETTVTVTGNGKDIHICPVVIARPGVTEFYPKNSEKGEPRDSSIVITFNKSLAAENDFSKIQIFCGGEEVSNSFLDPVLNENILTIAADKSNLIEVDSNKTKTVTVTLPSDIYFEDDGTKVLMNESETFNYKINSTTNTKAEITVSTTADKGTVTPSGTKSYNIGETFNLLFEPSDDYNFTGWNILDGEGEAVSDSILKIEDINSVSTKVTVLSEISGCSITPISELVPKVVSYSPVYSLNGNSCDDTIQIVFNVSLNSNTFNSFNNLYIQDSYGSTGLSLNNYYENPVLSEDGKTVTIKPKGDVIEEILGGESSTYIYLLLSNEIMYGEEKTFSKFYDSMIEVGYFMITKEREKREPLVDLLEVKRKDSGALISKSLFSNWTAEEYKLNHVNSLNIKCVASDSGSGIKEIKVTETLEKDVDGNSISLPAKVYSVKTLQNEGNGKKSADFEYSFLSEKDGVVRLDITVYDYSNNPSNTSTYYVIKDTCINSKEIFVYNLDYTGDSNKDYRNNTNTLKVLDSKTPEENFEIKNDLLNKIYIKVPEDKWFNGKTSLASSMNVVVTFEALDKTTQSIIPVYDVEKNVWSFDFPLEKITPILKKTDLDFKIIIKDEAGIEYIQNACLPKFCRPLYAEYRKYSSFEDYSFNVDGWALKDKDLSIYDTYHYYYYLSEDNNVTEFDFYDSNYCCLTLWDDNLNTEVHVVSTAILEGSKQRLYGLLGEQFVTKGEAAVQNVEIPKLEYIAVPGPVNSGKYEVTLYITSPIEDGVAYYARVMDFPEYYTDNEGNPVEHDDAGDWDECDSDYWGCDDYLFEIFESGKTVTPNDKIPGAIISTNQKISYSASVNIKLYTKKSSRIQIWAVKNGYKKIGQKYTDPHGYGYEIKIEPTYDNIAPTYEYAHNVLVSEFGDKITLQKFIDETPCKGSSSGFKTDDGTTTKGKVWLIPYINNTTLTKLENTATEDLLDSMVKPIDVVLNLENSSKIRDGIIDFVITEPGKYAVFLKIMDNNGNYSLKSMGIVNYFEASIEPQYLCQRPLLSTRAKPSFIFYEIIEDDYTSRQKFKCYIQYYDNSLRQWSNIIDVVARKFDGTNAAYQNMYYASFETKDKVEDSFIRVVMKQYYDGYTELKQKEENYHTRYSAPIYYYVDTAGFYSTVNDDLGTSPVEWDLKQKYVLKNSSVSYNFVSDAPILVQTYHNSCNFEDDILKWEHYGIITDTKMLGSGSVNYRVDKGSIPDGDYYCIIVHYSDGTRKISEVFKK